MRAERRRLGIVMHGATGRMGTNQHLVRSICAIREAGGETRVRLAVSEGDLKLARFRLRDKGEAKFADDHTVSGGSEIEFRVGSGSV